MINQARASAPSQAARDAELASAKAIRGGDDEDDRTPGGSGSGAKKWRDTGVYVDGKPMGVLCFGELPITLKPVWMEEKMSAEKEPGSNDPGYKIVYQRRYRFTDYLKALGVDLNKVKEIQVPGPRFSETIIASGKDLRGKAGKDFMFRFGAEIGGKPIPVVPDDFGNGMSPDKISTVMVYIDKKPPVLVPNEGLELDGKPVTNVPYYGDPLRGGVRLYSDDKLALVIKRPLLRQTKPEPSTDGVTRYKLWSLMEAQHVDTAKILEGWVLRGERRTEKLTREELMSVTFEMGEKEKNEMLLGDKKLHASAIAFHSRHIKPEELPQIRPEETN